MKKGILASFLWIILVASPSFAGDIESRLNSMEELLGRQQKTIEEQQKMIEELKKELRSVKRPETATGSPGTPDAERTPSVTGSSGLFGGPVMTNPYISFVLNSFFYSSSVDERKMGNRGIPGFSNLGLEQKKGFNVSEGELFLFAPVDPYFNLYANIPFKDDGASLEEAYFVTTALPEGLQAKGGKFKSNFSRLNAQHPHAWDFADLPLAYRAFLGKEGLIEKGVQATYLPSLPFYTLLGVEVLQGENEVIFNKNALGGPHAFSGFAKASFDFGDSSTILFGPYFLAGQARTATVSDGTFLRGGSTLYGLEGVYKWKPSAQRSFTLSGEYMVRNQGGTLQDTALGTEARLSRSQDGAYLQGLYQTGRWRFGARYDRLNLFADSYSLNTVPQDFGANPWRATGALEFNPSEFSRLRLQYNHDRSGRDGQTNHEVFLQLILGIGAHAAHSF